MATDAAELYSLCRLLDDIADCDIDGLDKEASTKRLRYIRCQLTQIDAGHKLNQLDPALFKYIPLMSGADPCHAALSIYWTGCCWTNL